MPEPTPAAELRTAAATLRAAAAVASPDWPEQSWHVEDCSERECPCIVYQGKYGPWDEAQDPPVFYIADGETPEAARWIALMDPTVGLALADWLEHMAKSCDSKVKAAAAVWDLSDPGQAAEAERFVAKGPFGLTSALAAARSINSKETVR